MADWWSPLISAAAGLTGVWVGSSLTLARERKQRQYDFARRQLEEFYSPFCALREEIRAKGEIRAQGSSDERSGQRGDVRNTDAGEEHQVRQ